MKNSSSRTHRVRPPEAIHQRSRRAGDIAKLRSPTRTVWHRRQTQHRLGRRHSGREELAHRAEVAFAEEAHGALDLAEIRPIDQPFSREERRTLQVHLVLERDKLPPQGIGIHQELAREDHVKTATRAGRGGGKQGAPDSA